MTDKKILEKAIRKAIDGGWETPDGQKIISIKDEWITYTSKYQKEYSEQIFNLIYNLDFAKALWGEKELEFEPCTHINLSTGKWVLIKNYQKKLQQMVISEDPIKYLGDNI